MKIPCRTFLSLLLPLLLYFGCNTDMTSWQPCYLTKQVYLPLTKPDQMSRGFNSFAQYQELMEKAFKTGIANYPIKHQGFHLESIEEKGDLTKLLNFLLKNLLPERDFSFLPEKTNLDSARFEVTLNFKGESFYFHTPIQGEKIIIGPILKELNRLASRFYPDHSFAVPNYPNNHLSILLFSEKEILEKAVKDGFPCTLSTSNWENNNWKKGIYPVIQIQQFPNEAEIKNMLLENLKRWSAKGYQVPQLQASQIYVTEMGENGLLHIVIDGASTSLNLQKGNWLHCDDEPWGIFLAYCLIKKNSTALRLEKPVRRQWKQIAPAEFLEKAETLLTKRL